MGACIVCAVNVTHRSTAGLTRSPTALCNRVTDDERTYAQGCWDDTRCTVRRCTGDGNVDDDTPRRLGCDVNVERRRVWTRFEGVKVPKRWEFEWPVACGISRGVGQSNRRKRRVVPHSIDPLSSLPLRSRSHPL